MRDAGRGTGAERSRLLPGRELSAAGSALGAAGPEGAGALAEEAAPAGARQRCGFPKGTSRENRGQGRARVSAAAHSCRAAGARPAGWRRCAASCLYYIVIFIRISGLLPVSARSPRAPRRSGGRGSGGPVPAPPAGTSRDTPVQRVDVPTPIIVPEIGEMLVTRPGNVKLSGLHNSVRMRGFYAPRQRRYLTDFIDTSTGHFFITVIR